MIELDAIRQSGVEQVEAVDLIMDMTFFRTLLPALAETGNRLAIFYETKSNLKYDQIALLQRAGISSIQPGIESLSGSILHLMKKGVAPYQNVRLLKWSLEHGLRVIWNILYGFPGEDPGEYARMAKRVPYLVHLQPPMYGCTQLLMNRFSPLHQRYREWGIRSIQPVPGYALVFGKYVRNTEQLAYFFDFDHEVLERAPAYVAPLVAAVSEWQASAGQAVFVMVERDDGTLLVDTRPVARHKETLLTAGDRRIFLACESGIGFDGLLRATGLSSPVVLGTLERLTEAGFVLDLEGRFLSLAVRADRWIAADTADALVAPLSEAVASRRLSALAG